MDENTLLPVRIKSRGDHVVGNEAKTLTRDSGGFTKMIVAATAESIIKCPAISNQDIHKVAGAVDGDHLSFETYEEEVNSRYGRPVIQIVMEEGEEAYDEIQDVFQDNPYLHAAVKGITVWEAIKELDCSYKFIVQTGNEESPERKLGTSYSAPDVVAASVVGEDDEIHERDLRELTPDMEWVVENWKKTGGHRQHQVMVSNTEDDMKALEELAFDEVEGEIADSYIRQADRSITTHHVKEREEAITDDEADRLAMLCGSTTKASDKIPRMSIDTGRIEERHHCGNCRRHVKVGTPETVET